MIKLYRLKDRQVREVEEDNALILRCLKRGGFVVGELPPAPKPKEPVVEEPLPPTEGENVKGKDQGKPVLAKHAPVGVPLQEVKGVEAKTDVVDVLPTEDAVDDESVELPEGDGELPEVTVTVDGEEIEGVVEETKPLSEMGMKELRAVAASYDLVVPFAINSKVALAAFIEGQLAPTEEEEDDG